MSLWRLTIIPLAGLLSAAALAEESGEPTNGQPVEGQPMESADERDFDLPGSEAAELIADGGLDLGDVDFEGSPLKRFAEKWPEDLVVAPVPGRSPQLGWQLTLGAGYFLETGNKDEDSDTPPSILGGFGMMSEIDLWVIRNAAIAYTRYVKQHPALRLSIRSALRPLPVPPTIISAVTEPDSPLST